jgi:hypothetical protein
MFVASLALPSTLSSVVEKTTFAIAFQTRANSSSWGFQRVSSAVSQTNMAWYGRRPHRCAMISRVCWLWNRSSSASGPPVDLPVWPGDGAVQPGRAI